MKKKHSPKVKISKELAGQVLKHLGIMPGGVTPESVPAWFAYENYRAVIALGRQAAREGEPVSANPYNPLLNDYESLMYEAWRKGYFDAGIVLC
jgi:hypothetical protein